MFQDEDRGLYLFHYTRLATAIEEILPSLKLRFGRFSTMRDPRETHWAFSTSFFGDIPGSNATFFRIQSRVRELKSAVRLLSLTQDDDRERFPQDEAFSRGFSHPRLWEQYADDHLGVCLVLSKDELIKAAKAGTDAHGVLEHRPVVYRDGEIKIEASGVDLQAIHQRGMDEVLTEHLDQHVDELFFTKLEDWASEVEYRFLIRWDAEKELCVDVQDALKGVIAGHAVAKQWAPALEALCEPRKIRLARMHWQNGLPMALPFKSRT